MELETILKRGGATLTKRLKSARHRKGYYVSKQGGEAIALSEANTLAYIKSVILKSAKALPANAYLGLWEHNGTFYIDVTYHFKDLAQAMLYGILNKQIAIYDIAKNRSIEL
jgi:hypothetical protein